MSAKNKNTGRTSGELKIKILAPTGVLYEGQTVSVSARNKVGAFDILPEHANFFSLLTEGEVKVKTKNDEFKFKISHGIVKCTKNNVVLFLGI